MNTGQVLVMCFLYLKEDVCFHYMSPPSIDGKSILLPYILPPPNFNTSAPAWLSLSGQYFLQTGKCLMNLQPCWTSVRDFIH